MTPEPHRDDRAHYFDDDPSVASDPVVVDVTLPDTAFTLETDAGVFSRGHLDNAHVDAAARRRPARVER